MKKSAFTIAEVLIAMGIIGIVVTFGVKATIQSDKGIRHIYSNTYHVLDTSLYNAMNFPRAGSAANPFDRNVAVNVATKRLCQKLTEYINTVEANPCEANAANEYRTARTDSSARWVTDMGNNAEFTPDKVMFTATNGVRYFITRRMPLNNGNGLEPLFFIIYADVNGTRFPNSMEYRAEADVNHRNRSKDPDIFAFAAIDNGRVLPLGVPEFDGKYMLSRISYYNIENSRNDENTDILYSRPSQPYYLMKAQAWGYYNASGDGASVRDTDFIEGNPYTYNGYIKSKINAQSRIYAYVQNYFEANGTVKKVPASANIKSASVQSGGYNCSVLSDEDCDVIIDKYVY